MWHSFSSLDGAVVEVLSLLILFEIFVMQLMITQVEFSVVLLASTAPSPKQ